jgi:hypothetical protein
MSSVPNLRVLDGLDSLLADWASPRTRRLLHALLTFALLAVTAYLAADGDWKKALVSLLLGLYASANHANTPTPALYAPDTGEVDDGLTYYEAGGGAYPVSGNPDSSVSD